MGKGVCITRELHYTHYNSVSIALATCHLHTIIQRQLHKWPCHLFAPPNPINMATMTMHHTQFPPTTIATKQTSSQSSLDCHEIPNLWGIV